MKKILFLLSFLLFAGVVFAKTPKGVDVPAPVQETFRRAYPMVNSVYWEKEDSLYEAHFTIEKLELTAVYNAAGKQMEFERTMGPQDVPASILEYMKTHYAKSKIKGAAKIVNSQGAITYEIELKGKDIIFDGSGAFLKEEKQK